MYVYIYMYIYIYIHIYMYIHTVHISSYLYMYVSGGSERERLSWVMVYMLYGLHFSLVLATTVSLEASMDDNPALCEALDGRKGKFMFADASNNTMHLSFSHFLMVYHNMSKRPCICETQCKQSGYKNLSSLDK